MEHIITHVEFMIIDRYIAYIAVLNIAIQTNTKIPSVKSESKSKSNDNEIEISSWKSKREGFGDNSVWMKEDGSIEGKVPKNAMKMKKMKQ